MRCEIALVRLDGLGGAAIVVLVGEAGRPVKEGLLGFVLPPDGLLGVSSGCDSCPLRTLPPFLRLLRIVIEEGM